MKCEVLVIEALGCKVYSANESCLIFDIGATWVPIEVAEGFGEVVIKHTARGPEWLMCHKYARQKHSQLEPKHAKNKRRGESKLKYGFLWHFFYCNT